MIYQLVNPTPPDALTFEADDPRLAVVVCGLLSEWRFMLVAEMGAPEFPALPHATDAEMDAVLVEHGFPNGTDSLFAFMQSNGERIADALDSLWRTLLDKGGSRVDIGVRAAVLSAIVRANPRDPGTWT